MNEWHTLKPFFAYQVIISVTWYVGRFIKTRQLNPISLAYQEGYALTRNASLDAVTKIDCNDQLCVCPKTDCRFV